MQNSATKKTPYKTDQEKGIKQIAVRLTKEEYNALKKVANDEERTISNIVRRLIFSILLPKKN